MAVSGEQFSDRLAPIYTYFFDDGTTVVIYKDCVKFERHGKNVIMDPKIWHDIGWREGGAPDESPLIDGAK